MVHQHDHVGHPATPGPLADASVRVARESDAPAVGLVQATVWREAYAAVLPPDVLETFEPQAFTAVWRRSLAAPPQGVYRLLVACAGDQVVGFAAIGPSQDPDASPGTGDLSALGVHPQARRVGHGSRLLNAAVDTLRGAGADRLHTWVLADDEGTRAFLLDAGLHPDGAFRDRVISPEGDTAREVRLVADITPEPPAG
ncbi:ribosomal protein S18 acetylase RimI-like enzyme [Phycicoccus badiiscoriae]|uniref:Ribosomal protein S18 acetylase RimI-like enzyme n=1 Tax=Pedococcus badiiscoriae TaxID=642776 RepID=A0A852WMM2_9MICO|nr:GNAT family N-acetyltransferase [Pedococcus badiiscoriae]NYG08064.1 ribosomal protein S18 acetylase RimI-like enzyme [Pedococcus badiiscoriae]